MTYTRAAVERAMKVYEVMVQALKERQPWIRVAEVLGVSARTVRRLRWRYEHYGFDGLFDHRHQRPSPRRVPLAEVQRVLRLYAERYRGFNVRHFHQIARREHGVTVSYSFVKKALQAAQLVGQRRPRGRHRRRREPRPCFGELVHLDGSLHAWLALEPAAQQTLIAVVDDATKRLLYAQLTEGGESAAVIMTALRAVLETYGIPGALYTDRAGWAVYTPTSGTAPDRSKLTQVGRALATLGIEHIVGFSPQARGRSERANGTLQGRLVNELRVAGIRTVAGANQYLRERFIPDYNATFGRAPTDPTSAFVPVGASDLDQILCHEEERTVARDNTVRLDGVVLQIDKQRGRRSCTGLHVLVRRHLDGRPSIWWGPRCLGRYTASGRALPRAETSPTGGYRHSGRPARQAAMRLLGPRRTPHSTAKRASRPAERRRASSADDAPRALPRPDLYPVAGR
jgi:transposase